VSSTAARIASNEARFTRANDEIAAVATTLAPIPYVPFLCECADRGCTRIAAVSLSEYAALRLFANHFLVAPTCLGGERAGTLVVERNARYAVVDRIV
jgi:hypothetical protein